MRRTILALALVLSACAQTTSAASDLPDLPPITGSEFLALLADLGRPAVVNVWASWCGPCRSEAPILRAAHAQFGDEVEFIGIDVQDNQNDAKAFITEFGLEFDHYFDRTRSVPNYFAAIGVPITMFFNSKGDRVRTHLGVIDERGLALGIDEIING